MPKACAQEQQRYVLLSKLVPYTDAPALWHCIAARTDEIYEACEDLLPVYEAVMR